MENIMPDDPVTSLVTRGDRLIAMRIANSLAELHSLDRNMPLRVVAMFLLIGQEEGLTVTQLAQRCGLRKTVASRYLSDLGPINRYGEPGFGLVTLVQKIYGDRRERRVYVTAHGAAIIRQIRVALTEARPQKRF